MINNSGGRKEKGGGGGVWVIGGALMALYQEPTINIAEPHISEEGKQECYIYI